MTSMVSLDDVRAARRLVSDVVRTTPLEPARGLADSTHLGPVYYKCENIQRAGSYKVRGAYVRIARLPAEQRARGVVAASAGNHAQGVAVAAAELGITATVFMPGGAPLPKVAATKGYGARVELVGSTVDDALAAARQFAERTGAVFIHPFDHHDVIAGQGTVALEILEQCPEVGTIIAGVGGGGLISGIGAVCKRLRPDVRLIGVQAEGAAAYPSSLAAGRPIRLPSYSTMADGIAVGCPGDITFEHVYELVDDVVTVSDEDISHALLLLLERNKLVVEPAGAVGLAALLADKRDGLGAQRHGREWAGAADGWADVTGPTVVVLSGGNIDPLLLLRVIEHGLAATGRFLRCTVRCQDRPGVLAAMLELIAERGGNVIDVMHQRYDPQLRIGEVSVALSVETRGPDHATHLVGALRDAGYLLTFWGAPVR